MPDQPRDFAFSKEKPEFNSMAEFRISQVAGLIRTARCAYENDTSGLPIKIGDTLEIAEGLLWHLIGREPYPFTWWGDSVEVREGS